MDMIAAVSFSAVLLSPQDNQGPTLDQRISVSTYLVTVFLAQVCGTAIVESTPNRCSDTVSLYNIYTPTVATNLSRDPTRLPYIVLSHVSRNMTHLFSHRV
jgi:hypothetical protein